MCHYRRSPVFYLVIILVFGVFVDGAWAEGDESALAVHEIEDTSLMETVANAQAPTQTQGVPIVIDPVGFPQASFEEAVFGLNTDEADVNRAQEARGSGLGVAVAEIVPQKIQRSAILKDGFLEQEVRWVWGEVISVEEEGSYVEVRYFDYDSFKEGQVVFEINEATRFKGGKSWRDLMVGVTVAIDFRFEGDVKFAEYIEIEKKIRRRF